MMNTQISELSLNAVKKTTSYLMTKRFSKVKNITTKHENYDSFQVLHLQD